MSKLSKPRRAKTPLKPKFPTALLPALGGTWVTSHPELSLPMSEMGHLELPQPWAETKGSGYEAPVTDPG